MKKTIEIIIMILFTIAIFAPVLYIFTGTIEIAVVLIQIECFIVATYLKLSNLTAQAEIKVNTSITLKAKREDINLEDIDMDTDINLEHIEFK